MPMVRRFRVLARNQKGRAPERGPSAVPDERIDGQSMSWIAKGVKALNGVVEPTVMFLATTLSLK